MKTYGKSLTPAMKAALNNMLIWRDRDEECDFWMPPRTAKALQDRGLIERSGKTKVKNPFQHWEFTHLGGSIVLMLALEERLEKEKSERTVEVGADSREERTKMSPGQMQALCESIEIVKNTNPSSGAFLEIMIPTWHDFTPLERARLEVAMQDYAQAFLYNRVFAVWKEGIIEENTAAELLDIDTDTLYGIDMKLSGEEEDD